jgi:chaperonin GroES
MENIPNLQANQTAKLMAQGAMKAVEGQVMNKFMNDITDSAQWVTDDQVSDPGPDVLPRPTGFRVLIRPLSIQEKSNGGIIIPESAKTAQSYLQTMGRVLAVGPLAWGRADYKTEGGWCKVGDIVLFSRHHGAALEVQGVKLKLVDDDAIHAVIPDYTKVKQ